MTFFVIFIAFIIIVIILARLTEGSDEKHLAELNEKLKEEGITFTDFKKIGTYVGGHPDLDDVAENILALRKDQKLKFYHLSINESVFTKQ